MKDHIYPEEHKAAHNDRPVRQLPKPSIYHQMVDAGVAIDHWQSDLYAEVTSESQTIVNSYEFKDTVGTFRAKDNSLWFDIPFAYDPFYQKFREGE